MNFKDAEIGPDPLPAQKASSSIGSPPSATGVAATSIVARLDPDRQPGRSVNPGQPSSSKTQASSPMRTDLSKALAVVISVCIRRSEMDDVQVSIWHRRMAQVLGEYRPDVALASLDAWPKSENGKFWPTENELRDLCEKIDGERRAREERHRFVPSNRGPLSPIKTDTAYRFAEKVRAADERTAEVYLDGDASYRGNEIHLSPIGVIKLQPFATLARAMGLYIVDRNPLETPRRD